MNLFHFHQTGDLSARWHPAEQHLSWNFDAGDLFFLARWELRDCEVGLIGLLHPAVQNQDDRLQQLFPHLLSTIQYRHHIPLEEVLQDLPGWGLIVRDPLGLRAFRDPVGRLPLMWRRHAGILVGTRPASITPPTTPICHSRLESFLRDETDDARDDFLQGVRRIRPGEVLVADSTQYLRFHSFWPSSPAPPVADSASHQIQKALTTAIQAISSRSGTLISLSGGYDSTLLLALFHELGTAPRTLSMVAPGTHHFDELHTIQKVLAALNTRGEFFDISGPQQWSRPEVHHPVADFGPTFMAEAAYFQNFHHHARTLQEQANNPPVLVSGLGSDQIFFVSPTDWARDLLWQGSPPPTSSPGSSHYKLRIKRIARDLGLSFLPARYQARQGPPWMPKKNKWDLTWSPLYNRSDWLQQRVEYFRSWNWEYTTRLLERYRRTTGLFVELPFLHIKVLQVGLRLPPSILRARGEMKAPLRTLLEPRVPSSFFEHRRLGCFDEIIWDGLRYHLRPTPEKLLRNSRLSSLFSLDQQNLLRLLHTNLHQTDIFRIQHGFDLWHAIAAELWLREMSRHPPASPP